MAEPERLDDASDPLDRRQRRQILTGRSGDAAGLVERVVVFLPVLPYLRLVPPLGFRGFVGGGGFSGPAGCVGDAIPTISKIAPST